MKTIHYLLILDRSGSMSSVREQTVGGVNAQIDAIKKAKEDYPDATIKATVMLFESSGASGYYPNMVPKTKPEFEKDWFQFLFLEKDASELEHIKYEDFVPAGGTPLNDAIAYGIQTLQENLGESLSDPELSLLVSIFTDGDENTSRVYKRDQVMQMIEALSVNGKWTFTFMGAGGIAQVQEVAAHYGISKGATLAYAAGAEGTRSAFLSHSGAVSGYMTRSLSAHDGETVCDAAFYSES